ncbi:hypothetical protein DJ568_06855 [Mucilaginibacter hurinus]|uniref:Nuclear transport factor 2 family protein n=1 Tax=Mucilaginibacter hurinus TaxID=2201324 RepID=A0A367GS05_9SPHI|nr:hypothetical protein [Mucilaginibacter hurinus]RCH55606.1 hypothetical protein DJ568_06855 [Mucilaginibacter hurinus]
MVKTSFLLLSIILLSACYQKKNKSNDNIPTDSLNYPFKTNYGINWVKGDEKNALVVLNYLKKYVDGDIKGGLQNFADTVIFTSDNFYYEGTRDSLAIILSAERAKQVTVLKDFETWLTAYYPDKDDTWVTLWYTEKWTDKTGKQDSLNYIDDVLVKDGKIVKYQENVRHYVSKE